VFTNILENMINLDSDEIVNDNLSDESDHDDEDNHKDNHNQNNQDNKN